MARYIIKGKNSYYGKEDGTFEVLEVNNDSEI